ncbi:MAG: PBSX family phage terminase large subunit [Chitinophagales bacterium]
MTYPEVRLTDLIAPSFYDIHWDIADKNHVHYWLKGGRGSTKSTFAAIEIILGIMSDPDANAVALRKVKDTLHDSVFEQLVWAIEALGVSQYWDVPKAQLVLTYLPTGQKILFRGADKPKKIKSIKFKRGYCKYIWYEELDEFNGMEEIRMINQSLRRGGQDFVVFYSYNPPKSMTNWVNGEAQLTRPDRLVHHSNYLTVPREWLGEQFIIEAEALKERNESAYNHEYMGEITGTGGEVFGNVKCRAISDEEISEFEVIRRGLDFGFAVDPLAYAVCAYNRKYRRLFIFFEIYKVGLSNRAAYKLIAEENKSNGNILADSAEPKSINELNAYGLNVSKVKKGPDSVDYGIKFLQDLEAIIIDDTRCPETAREFMNYELEKDANGNFKAGYPDKNNHSIDAVRYAMNYECVAYQEEQKKPKLPADLPPDLRRDLERDPKAMAHFLQEHPEYRG